VTETGQDDECNCLLSPTDWVPLKSSNGRNRMLTCCIVCGFDLGFKPWNEDSPSDEICPCCGIQYGYDDADNADLQRQQVYEQWRLRWVKGGMTW
jgi:hypothetical protein